MRKNVFNSIKDEYPSDNTIDTKKILTKKTITSSKEEGFTGDPQTWFSDEIFYQNLPGKSDVYHEKDYYFNSYSTFYIHEEMIKDKIRTGSYKKAIENNKTIFKDKIVLDIGSGTGILSIFAAKAGAKHVYGIEYADIADYSKEIIKQNNLSDKITIIQSKVEEANLPVDKVDIIISEWMGYFLLYESMLDTLLFARDKWLKKDGYLLPDKAQIYLAGIQDTLYKYNKIDSWDNVYGFNFSVLKNPALAEPIIDNFPNNNIISNSCKIFDIDLYTVKVEDLDFSAGYEIIFNKDDTFNGFVTWFDVEFDKIPNKITLSTSPYEPSTHWKQVMFYSKNDIEVKKNEKLKGSICVIKDKMNFRFINSKISFHFDNGSKKLDWYQLYKIA
jgi:protein arginine N-methyltransferase 1